jgi:hypothetical protein
MNFDSALPELTRLVRDILGPDTLDAGLFLRDAEGRLTFVLRSEVSRKDRDSLEKQASDRLGSYVDGAVATPAELFDDSLINDESALDEQVILNDDVTIFVKLVDRRIIGQDWDRPDFRKISNTVPVVTFFSCKGGVGRSTALVLTAAAMSQQGKNVLIIDFDLEAPGLGPLLLADKDLPPFGLLDLLITERIAGVSDQSLENFISPSPLTGGKGLIEVVPAVGQVGRDNASNVVLKLGRAFLEGRGVEGQVTTFLTQMREIVRRLIDRGKSDVVLVDARAGLSESSAPAVLGLGGDVLLFGVDTNQTFECYRYLLSHLGRFAREGGEDDWRYRMRMVHAKAGRGEDAWRKFRERAYEIFADTLYEEAAGSSLDVFNFDIDDPQAPHYAWPIPFDLEYSEFDPLTKTSSLGKDFYERSFGPFIDRLTLLAFNEKVDD